MTEGRKLNISLAVIALLVLLIAMMAYKFIVVGSTGASSDNRTVILIEPAERSFVLAEMRGFLAGVQRLAEALANEDFARVATVARSMGSGADAGEPTGLMGKLPLEFKTLGFSVHADFDRLAKNAAEKPVAKELLRQLSGTLQKCVACHASYQFGAPPAKQAALQGRLTTPPPSYVVANKY